ncbi:MAG: ATP-dependent DNA helicase RecG [Candidatus Doudnabacteria bacterium]|nr:ATP-dependent DNA helicase RecG [Candidatus Doudnabacteria bacterium]
MQLNTPVTELPGISDKYAQKLANLGIHTIRDLITHFPRYHKDTTSITDISELQKEGKYVIQGRMSKVSSVRIPGRRTLQTALISDASGTIKATWFNQPYLAKSLSTEVDYLVLGNLKMSKNRLQFYPESVEEVKEGEEQLHLGRIAPQYALTAGLGIRWLRAKLDLVLQQLEGISDLQDEVAKVDGALPAQVDIIKDLREEHFPSSEPALESATRNLQLRELVHLQLKTLNAGAKYMYYTAPRIHIDPAGLKELTGSLPFALTADQEKAVNDVIADMDKDKPMRRLLQGDVGSGKTAVAVIASYATYSAGLQTVVLAPTTILAEQHLQTFHKYLANSGAKISLITSETKNPQDADILIGTSAILARQSALLKKVGLVITDEQHRFGANQREIGLEFSPEAYPHQLDMTATPIPRTLALGLFGDVEVSRILQKPAGRLPISTRVVPEEKRPDALKWLTEQVELGNQAYWVCPLIEESEKLEAKGALATFEELKELLPHVRIGILHGQLKPDIKAATMQAFKQGDIDLLVCTSVIEVGVDVPRASVMVIEGAERFGLAQLHQIRGRVGRGETQSWCLLFANEELSSDAQARLDFFAHTNDGLEIAEFDLKHRGPGEVYGYRQSGIPPLKIANFQDLNLILHAREVAKKLYTEGIRRITLFEAI